MRYTHGPHRVQHRHLSVAFTIHSEVKYSYSFSHSVLIGMFLRIQVHDIFMLSNASHIFATLRGQKSNFDFEQSLLEVVEVRTHGF